LGTAAPRCRPLPGETAHKGGTTPVLPGDGALRAGCVTSGVGGVTYGYFPVWGVYLCSRMYYTWQTAGQEARGGPGNIHE